MERYLIDSNAVIDYLNGRLPVSGMNFLNVVVDYLVMVSIITKKETLGFKTTPEDELLTNDFMDIALVIDLNESIVNQTIAIRKMHKIKTPDAIIAATALNLDLTLISRNKSDFDKIHNLKLINPYEI